MELLTCYITTYNRCDYLKEQIESVLKQTYYDFKLVILDNASIDGTEELVRSYDDERISYVKHLHNIGGLENIKYAFSICDTKYLIVLHDDDFCEPELFETEIDVLEKQEDVVVVSTNAYSIDENSEKKGVLKCLSEQEKIYIGNDYFSQFLKDANVMFFPTIMYRNSYLKKNHIEIDGNVGPCADVVFCSDIYRYGGKGIELNRPLINYRTHDRQDSVINYIPMHLKLYKYIKEEQRFKDSINILKTESSIILKKHLKRVLYIAVTSDCKLKDVVELLHSFASIFNITARDLWKENILLYFVYILRKPLKMTHNIYKAFKFKR